MNEIKQPYSFQRQNDDEEIHRLSFCDLPISAATPHTPSAQPDHLFTFSATTAAAHSYYNDIVFCGKIIHGDAADQDQLNDFQKRDFFAAVKSQSVRKPSFRDHGSAESRRLSVSTRFAGEVARPKCSTGDVAYHAQRVNITSLTSMSAKSRRRMFMFGPVKFKPEMELSAIKQRQAKLPAAEKTSPTGGRGKSHWGMVKSRSHLASVLARSFGCIPVAAGGGGYERWVGVPNCY
ncbi:hypothetical protein C2S53_013157 [Perilla frutescens var. hirtella]|uniref:Uncharacterized protein n=1 Tax=Perilla frutescens var. hirtella TaxID=608512 RepID=A0AAD4JQH6_PERFH|nr:hypothetical protein C2S53_013157 [Perilla frutescens var. hirtella]